jgi:hypothetical protein
MRVRRAARCHAAASSFQQRKKDKKAIIMGTNTPKKNRTDETTSEQLLIDGLNKHAAAIQAIAIAGASVTTKDIVATLQSRIDSAKAALSTRATWRTAVQADRALRDKTKTFVAGLRQALLVAFVGQIDTLADFGLTGRKSTALTPEEMLVRAAKAKATRAARHTMGSKQKAEIKGTVAPTAPASPVPSAPTPSPTPAPPAAPVLPVAPTAPAPQPVTPVAPTVPTTPPATPVAPPASPVVAPTAPATPPASTAGTGTTPVNPAPAPLPTHA